MAKVRKRTWTNKNKGTTTVYMVDYTDQAGKRRFMSFDKKKDADAALIQVQSQIQKGTHTANSVSLTLSEAAELWITRGTTEGLERSTLREYKAHVRNHIDPILGSTKLSQLTTPRIEAFRDELLNSISRPMARKVLTSLKSLLTEAQRRGLVAQNVAAPVKIEIRSRHTAKLQAGKDIPSKAEIQSLLSETSGKWRPFFVTAIFTGLRASELRGLTWDDVDFDAKVIHVRQRANLWGEIGSPKSRAGNRDVPASPMVINVLREWRLACPNGTANLVFPNGKGKVESHANIVNRAWNPLQIGALGKVKYGLHSLRHFCASWLIEQRFSPKRVQEWLGHSSITMTFDVYGHLFPSLEDDHAKLAAGEAALIGN